MGLLLFLIWRICQSIHCHSHTSSGVSVRL